MFKGTLRRRPSFIVRMVGGLCVLIAFTVVNALLTDNTDVGLLAVLAYVVVYLPLCMLPGSLSLRRHQKAIQHFVDSNALKLEKTGKRTFMSELGSISRLQKGKEESVSNIIIGPDWKYGDFSYRSHLLSGDTRHAGVMVYYAVMSTQLSRELPNIVFDSKKSIGRQFRFEFSRSQRHHLEGDFDNFFVTYFAPGYTIDSMSFITPEVMWAMRDAAKYDIEIYGNRLFLYSTVYDPQRLIPDMASKLLAIKKELADNIDTYRDDRLSYAEGRQKVSADGIHLTVSYFWPIVAALLILAFYIFSIWQDHYFK